METKGHTVTMQIPHVRGRLPSLQASRVRAMMLQAHEDTKKIVAIPCSYDGLSSRLVQEAGFPLVFLSGFTVASSQGLPDVGYTAMHDMCTKIQEVVRQVDVPIMVDGDTGYGSAMNVKATVENFAFAGAAAVMIEDQTWPKRCGHTQGKSVVSRGEAFSRMQAAVDARDEGLDIFILGRTDALVIGWEEAIFRAKKYLEIGVDAVFIEALPDVASMKRAISEVPGPVFVNIIEGGLTENVSAADLARLGFCAALYPITLVASHIKSTRKSLADLKQSLLTGPPPMILSFEEVTATVGFEKYWKREQRYAFVEDDLLSNGRVA